MSLDMAAVQAALPEDGLDGWLLYDFRGSNPIARAWRAWRTRGHIASRRWYYLIPREGTPRKLVHAIERHNLEQLPGRDGVYAGRERSTRPDGAGRRPARVAMEYSPDCAIPYLSRVDAGTIDLLRQRGVEVVSSGDLVQRFEAAWDEAALASHREASVRLYRIKDRAFEFVRDGARAPAGRPPSTTSSSEMVVVRGRGPGQRRAAGGRRAGERRQPALPATAARHRRDRPRRGGAAGSLGQAATPGAVFADITWMGFTGGESPTGRRRHGPRCRGAATRRSRWSSDGSPPAATARLARWTARPRRCSRRGLRRSHPPPHRPQPGEEVHGNGVHMDDYETHDDRRLMPGTGFTIEPGLYFDTFGVRTEINMAVGARRRAITGASRRESC